jgi:hypothetical protein
MYWQLFQIIVFTFVPLPIQPKIKRPDPTKNLWTFECEGFTSCYELSKLFYTSTIAAEQLKNLDPKN